MAKDFLKGARAAYDVVVIGSGLGGLSTVVRTTSPSSAIPVLVLEHHYQFGGLATWFTRKRGHIFDISLHGFPIGMIKSCRKYWTPEIASRIEQLHDIQLPSTRNSILQTTFDREDFTRACSPSISRWPPSASPPRSSSTCGR